MINVEILRRGAGRKIPARGLKEMAGKILEALEQSRVELSLALVGDRQIRELNAGFRGKDEPTDVLSFPSGERLPTGDRLLGDVVISVEEAARQAKERKKTLDEEMAALLIHGILHLLGYDHERSAKEARVMSGLEKKIYRGLCEQGRLRL